MAKTYREIEAWQIAVDLRRGVVRLVSRAPASRDLRFCDQIKDSAASVASNIAEGFGRYNPAEFARFLSIAKASLNETDNHLRDGVERTYYPPEAAAPLIVLAARCAAAVDKLQAYLRKPSTQQRFHRRNRGL